MVPLVDKILILRDVLLNIQITLKLCLEVSAKNTLNCISKDFSRPSCLLLQVFVRLSLFKTHFNLKVNVYNFV